MARAEQTPTAAADKNAIPQSAPTAAPNAQLLRARGLLDERHLEERQGFTETCGFWSQTAFSLEAYTCLDGCSARGDYWGCAESLYTTCYDATAEACEGSSTLGESAACCTQSTWTNCMTALKEINGDTKTAYECWNTQRKGLYTVFDNSEDAYTSTSETSETTTEGPTTSTESESSTSSLPTSTTSSDEGSGGGGSDTPIGAIVGGVVGGVAVIAILAFIFWFIRHKKKKDAASSVSPQQQPAQMQPQYQPVHPGYPSGSPYQQGPPSVYGPPSTYGAPGQGYAPTVHDTNSMYGHYDPSKTPQMGMGMGSSSVSHSSPPPQSSYGQPPPSELPAQPHRQNEPVEMQ